MQLALAEAGMDAQRGNSATVYFRGHEVGTFRADLVVESKVLIEIKASESLPKATEAQALNYLRATDLEVALILHFGQKPNVLRRLLTNDRKRSAGSVCSV
jgi:GxxExxY protein